MGIYDKEWIAQRAYAMAVKDGEVADCFDVTNAPIRVARDPMRAAVRMMERTGEFGDDYDRIHLTEPDSVWLNMTVVDLNLDAAALLRSRFVNSTFTNVSLLSACMANSIWLDMDVAFGDFERAVLANTRFIDCRFDRTTFFRAQIQGSVMENCYFHGCHFDLAKIKGLKVDNCVFHHCSFVESKNPEALFKGSRFIRCTWKDMGRFPPGTYSKRAPWFSSWDVLEGGKSRGSKRPPPPPPFPFIPANMPHPGTPRYNRSTRLASLRPSDENGDYEFPGLVSEYIKPTMRLIRGGR